MSEYAIRLKIEQLDEGNVATYHYALRLANELANAHPGLTFEVVEDKVWARAQRRNDAP